MKDRIRLHYSKTLLRLAGFRLKERPDSVVIQPPSWFVKAGGMERVDSRLVEHGWARINRS